MMKSLGLGALVAAACLWSAGAFAQSGAIDKAVGGYSFTEAAKEAPTTKKDGKPLTFAIITHTAGNGFFDPVYVGAQVAANAFGINLIKLGSESRSTTSRARSRSSTRSSTTHDQRRHHDDAAGRRL